MNKFALLNERKKTEMSVSGLLSFSPQEPSLYLDFSYRAHIYF